LFGGQPGFRPFGERMTEVSRPKESREVRLAQYLKEFVGLRSTVIRDVEKYEDVLWFWEMPKEQDCQSGAWDDGSIELDSWLELRKQEFKSAPVPSAPLAEWLDARVLRKALVTCPPLLETIRRQVEVLGESGPTKSIVEVSRSDEPEVDALYAVYAPNWEAWSADHRRRESIQAVYAALFGVYTKLRRQGEVLELVIGLGLVEWRAASAAIRRHAVVGNAEIHFDPKTGVIRVGPHGDSAKLRLEDEVLEAEQRPERAVYEAIREQLDQLGDAIWDKELARAPLVEWARSLDPDSVWSAALQPAPLAGKKPTVSFAPALILRPRKQAAMVRIYERIAAQLMAPGVQVPVGWERLTDEHWEQPGAEQDGFRSVDSAAPDSASARPDELYFPLPTNREQRRIVEALQHDQGVLVQGPPGTGKSHTIANLVCHLLATGKRVLVTAETSRALEVLRGKLPADIQPLCVSLLGQGGSAFEKLNTAVQGITTRQVSYSAVKQAEQIADVEVDLARVRRQRDSLDSALRSLREAETARHSLCEGAYHGSVSAIAMRVASERQQYDWLALAPDVETPVEVAGKDVLDWLATLRRYSSEQVQEALLKCPRSADIPSADAFQEHVRIAAEAQERSARSGKGQGHRDYALLRSLAHDVRGVLRRTVEDMEKVRIEASRMHEPWPVNALKEVVGGRRGKWQSLHSRTVEAFATLEATGAVIAKHVVDVPPAHNLHKVRADVQAVIAHFEGGGSWVRASWMPIAPKELKGKTYLRHEFTVDGNRPESLVQLALVRDFVEFELALLEAETIWEDVGVREASEDRRTRAESVRESQRQLGRVLEYAASADSIAEALARCSPPVAPPNWAVGEGSDWFDVLKAADDDHALELANDVLRQLQKLLESLTSPHGVHPVVPELLRVVRSRDVEGYRRAVGRVKSIELVRRDQIQRVEVESVLEEISPGLAHMVAETDADPCWDVRLAAIGAAQRWAIVDRWLARRGDPAYQQELSLQRHEAEATIGEVIAELAGLKAWGHFFARLRPFEIQALKSWRAAVLAMGKGTGKSAKLAGLKRQALAYMDKCRDAVPVWIMPRYLVAEMIDPTPGLYDLVIVDEASQLGVDGLFLFFIAKKIIVVGDDQQISPAGVGIDSANVAGLQQHFLDGVPHHHALAPESSLYANAKIRFDQNIVLREHFRCMPEIIQFSNDLCYASNGTPLDPLRSYPADRLEPIMLRYVADGRREGASGSAINTGEASAIVAAIKGCLADPRYEGRTLGVISLQGQRQAQHIESLILRELEPEVIEKRRLVCGDAYTFQGDERNIIFLSMVASRGVTRVAALTKPADRQRYNVAASRAQDQLWLFHSVQPEELNPECMRARLLHYMLDPQRQATEEGAQRFDSDFERDVYRSIVGRGFRVLTQVAVGDRGEHKYRIDLVVEGLQGRLAIECDGEKWHGPAQYDADMARQRDLERAGWTIARIRGGDYYRDPKRALVPIWAELERLGIKVRSVVETSEQGSESATLQVPIENQAPVRSRTTSTRSHPLRARHDGLAADENG